MPVFGLWLLPCVLETFAHLPICCQPLSVLPRESSQVPFVPLPVFLPTCVPTSLPVFDYWILPEPYLYLCCDFWIFEFPFLLFCCQLGVLPGCFSLLKNTLNVPAVPVCFWVHYFYLASSALTIGRWLLYLQLKCVLEATDSSEPSISVLKFIYVSTKTGLGS